MSFPLLRKGDTVDRMAPEFNPIVTASFDGIRSQVALDSIHPLSRTATLSAPHSSSSEKNPTRRSAASFFRKVKSHATSLLASQQSRLDAASAPPPPARSFVPSLPAGPSYLPTSTPLPNTSPRTFLTRTAGKQPHTSDSYPPDLDPIRSFLDHDDDDDNCVDRWVCPPPPRSIAFAPAGPNPRLSSVFASAPVIFGLSSPSVSVSTTHLIPEKSDVVRTVSRADPVHVCAYFLFNLFYPDPLCLGDIQSATKTQASKKVVLPKDCISSFPSLVPVQRPFPSDTIVLFSPLLRLLCRHWAFSSIL